jgi:hypothetical protein
VQGLSAKSLKSLENTLKSKFDRLSLRFLGLIPRRIEEKHVIFKTSKENLISIFLRSLGTRNPNKLEEQTLKTMLNVANGYMNSLRDKTVAKVVHDVDSYVRNQKSQDKSISINAINKMVEKEMDKASNHIKLIANAESNKAGNVGTALQIAKIAEERKEDDPTIFFIVTIDDVTGPEEFVLHLLPDEKTPRVWKLSEIGHEYHKVGDPNPKLPGLHPNCRCKLTYLAPGWGFDASGRITYKGPNWDEFKSQRETYGLPR